VGILTKTQVAEELLKETRELNKKFRGFDEVAESLQLSDQVEALKRTVSDLEIQRDRKQEEFDKREREIQHKLGLERKRMEFETKAAEDNARLAVREENLKAEKDRFTDEMKFMRERMEKEVDQLNNLLHEVMQMVPKVNVDRRIRENYDDSPKAIESGDTDIETKKKK
jgi:hypothetical protein